ncbi:hypothetical protein [Pseudoalteromonas carrageenovora]|uniref:hypothetical protein n=1 Tax=Pseudoalteromonas carrageenovora TaxID=227 RepID=UPI0026E2FA6E|nr:hypothetical protein [Pseudoalteromonas carrageenovora]MDO6547272.1 hypothetical protein [Pseudoalteromonas carrageenovora]MDO6831720.1 hypothetical protein [Pseudoalteromonas carrageenovora]
MKFIKLVPIMLTLGGVCNAYAATITNANINSVQSYTNGTIGIITNKQTINPASCSSVSKYIIPSTDKGVNTTLSVFLAAKMSSKPVIIYIHDSSCSSGYPLITSVVLP